MAIAASLLRSEMRRHLLMNVSLVASCVVGGTVVTNERGLFVPLTHGMSESARAFAAMFTQSHLLPDGTDLSDARMASPLSAFEVTADSRDLRRRLMDAWGQPVANGAADYNRQLAEVSGTTLRPQELASNTNPVTNFGRGGNGNGNGNGNGGQQAAGAQPQGAQQQAVVQQPAAAGQNTNNNNNNALSVLDTNRSGATLASNLAGESAQLTQVAAATDTTSNASEPVTGAVPEPSTWAMLIAGFGLVGYFLRTARRRSEVTAEANS